MKKLSLASWNVNGLRAIERKGFLSWLKQSNYDVVALQETKVSPDTVLSPELKVPPGYYSYWDYSTEKKGYSGVVVYTKLKPLAVQTEFGSAYQLLAKEGRLIQLEFPDFTFFNIYFPNGKASPERLRYKLEFYEQFLNYLQAQRRGGRPIIFCGDVNTAHQAIDLARPKENEKVSGFLPVERAWLDRVLEAGFLDTFRLFEASGGHYTWWDQKTHARDRNIGWRIDYFFASAELRPFLLRAFIQPEVLGSDHAPIGLTLTF